MTPQRKSKFGGFERRDFAYSTVAGHDILASIFTSASKTATEPNAQQSHTKAPVLVFWHGGGFVVGDRLYEPWWPDWIIEFARSHGAMVVAPDYRLLPEACGADILQDMDAFWTWFLGAVPALAEAESWSVRPDLDRILCAGHSAGASIAVHSALERPDARLKALVSCYGALDDSNSGFRMARPRMILGSWPPPPREAQAKIRSYMRLTDGTVRTGGDPVEMWGLFTSILQQGRLLLLYNRVPDPRLDILARIEAKKSLPPIWLLHGENDSVVPVSCSTDFSRRLAAILPDTEQMLSVRPAGEHCFDVSMTMEEACIAEGCRFLLRYW